MIHPSRSSHLSPASVCDRVGGTVELEPGNYDLDYEILTEVSNVVCLRATESGRAIIKAGPEMSLSISGNGVVTLDGVLFGNRNQLDAKSYPVLSVDVNSEGALFARDSSFVVLTIGDGAIAHVVNSSVWQFDNAGHLTIIDSPVGDVSSLFLWAYLEQLRIRDSGPCFLAAKHPLLRKQAGRRLDLFKQSIAERWGTSAAQHDYSCRGGGWSR